MQCRPIPPVNPVTLALAGLGSDPKIADGDQIIARVQQGNALPHPGYDAVFLKKFFQFVGSFSADRTDFLAAFSKPQGKAGVDRLSVDAAIDTGLEAHLTASHP